MPNLNLIVQANFGLQCLERTHIYSHDESFRPSDASFINSGRPKQGITDCTHDVALFSMLLYTILFAPTDLEVCLFQVFKIGKRIEVSSFP